MKRDLSMVLQRGMSFYRWVCSQDLIDSRRTPGKQLSEDASYRTVGQMISLVL